MAEGSMLADETRNIRCSGCGGRFNEMEVTTVYNGGKYCDECYSKGEPALKHRAPYIGYAPYDGDF